MFKIIAQRSGPGGPEWLSDHPNPGNRYEYISREARGMRVSNSARDNRAFNATQVRLQRLPPPPAQQARR
jgi:hypothetical protein